MSINGVIFNIQRFSIHDGPGIRTTIFFKGCSLHCFWCHNPEGLHKDIEIQFYPDRCIACGDCVSACPEGAQHLENGQRIYDRSRCVVCGKCLETCYTGALEKTGEEVTVAQVMNEILQDRAFYSQSGGGVTLSGGDPLVQRDFTAELLKSCKAEGLHTAVETAVNCSWQLLESILPETDMIMMDLKHMDPERHRQCTGVSNERILANAARLTQMGKPIIFRTPVIPGVNDAPEEIAAIAGFIKKITDEGRRAGFYQDDAPRLELLPFHKLAASKYHSLGLDYRSEGLAPPTHEHMLLLGETASAQGIQVLVR